MVESLEQDLRQSATASLLQAYCLEKLGKKQAAAATLGHLAEQLTALQKSADPDGLLAVVQRAQEALRLGQSPEQRRRDWFADFEPNGTLHWLIYTARLRQGELTDKATK